MNEWSIPLINSNYTKVDEGLFWERELTGSNDHHHSKGTKGTKGTKPKSPDTTPKGYSKPHEFHAPDTNQYSPELDSMLHPADDVRLQGKGYKRSYYMNLDAVKQMKEYENMDLDSFHQMKEYEHIFNEQHGLP